MTPEIIGHKWKADFGTFAFQLDFRSPTSMRLRPVNPNGSLGDTTTVDITRTELRPGLWLVSWQEPALGATVVHVQDYDSGVVWTHISILREQKFMREKGRLTKWTSAP